MRTRDTCAQGNHCKCDQQVHVKQPAVLLPLRHLHLHFSLHQCTCWCCFSSHACCILQPLRRWNMHEILSTPPGGNTSCSSETDSAQKADNQEKRLTFVSGTWLCPEPNLRSRAASEYKDLNSNPSCRSFATFCWNKSKSCSSACNLVASEHVQDEYLRPWSTINCM